jgi:hypothetical protein
MAFASVHGEASTEHDRSHACVAATKWDYSAQVSASSSQSEWRKAFRWTL